MRDKKYTLTISILASNRKDTFGKTLESVKPILDNVSSELIIVDTGCDEESLELIRKYTDKIVPFQWCNDFSKARNAGLRPAQGQWFMFLDDDEWFEDVKEFIDFFNGEDKDKYGYGKYIQRNYRNIDGAEWSDCYVGRVFKINDGTEFVDIIHERPVNINGPIKMFDSYVHHYGYVHQTEESRKAHRERNLSLLRVQVEKEPRVARHYVHMLQEYCGAKEYDDIIDLAPRGIADADMSDINNQKDVPGLYAAMVWALAGKGCYEQVLVQASEYMGSNYCNRLCEASLCSMCVSAAYSLGRYEECANYAIRYLEIGDELINNPLERSKMSSIILIYAFEKENYDRVTYMAVRASVYSGNDRLVRMINERVGIDSKICQKPLEQWMDEVDKWSQTVKIAELIKVMQALSSVANPDTMHIKYFKMVFEEALFVRKKLDDISFEGLREEIMEYAYGVIGFYSGIYRQENMEKYSGILPKRCQAAVMWIKLCKNNMVFDEITENKLNQLWPIFAGITGKYKELVHKK